MSHDDRAQGTTGLFPLSAADYGRYQKDRDLIDLTLEKFANSIRAVSIDTKYPTLKVDFHSVAQKKPFIDAKVRFGGEGEILAPKGPREFKTSFFRIQFLPNPLTLSRVEEALKVHIGNSLRSYEASEIRLQSRLKFWTGSVSGRIQTTLDWSNFTDTLVIDNRKVSMKWESFEERKKRLADQKNKKEGTETPEKSEKTKIAKEDKKVQTLKIAEKSEDPKNANGKKENNRKVVDEIDVIKESGLNGEAGNSDDANMVEHSPSPVPEERVEENEQVPMGNESDKEDEQEKEEKGSEIATLENQQENGDSPKQEGKITRTKATTRVTLLSGNSTNGSGLFSPATEQSRTPMKGNQDLVLHSPPSGGNGSPTKKARTGSPNGALAVISTSLMGLLSPTRSNQ